ncbi:hypothetical protein FBU30_007278 [Linnemannia zychae]|nr:hypothetical protein FBU30_007278 [Linnemannia zychae]
MDLPKSIITATYQRGSFLRLTAVITIVILFTAPYGTLVLAHNQPQYQQKQEQATFKSDHGWTLQGNPPPLPPLSSSSMLFDDNTSAFLRAYQQDRYDQERAYEPQRYRQDLERQCRQILDTSSFTSSSFVNLQEPSLMNMAGPPENSTWRLWYRKWADPGKANDMERKGFVLGNGRTQVLVGGGVHMERIRLSEESAWTGGPGVDRVAQAPESDTPADEERKRSEEEDEKYRGGNVPTEEASQRQEAFEKVRLAIMEKKYLRPKDEIAKSLKGDERGFGSPVGIGELVVEEVKRFETVREYRRELDLETGVASVSFFVGDVQYKREHFCSFPDAVCVMRLQASEPKSISIKVSLASAHENTGTAEYTNMHNRLAVRARLGSNNMTTEAMVTVTTEGASGVSLANSRQVVALGFDAVTLYYTMGTGWNSGGYPNFEDKDPHDRLSSEMVKAVGGVYEDQYLKHVNDHQTLFQGFQLDLGQTKNQLPTDELIDAVKKHQAEKQEETYLDVLLVQYGRYLLIASSRPGALPVSGQSLLSLKHDAEGADDPKSGYKMHIDLQMNYWLAESTGLGETVTPLIDYMENLLVPRGHETASLYYGARGWVIHPYSNIWAHTGPTSQDETFYLPTAAAWLCQHAWDRYLYSQDYYFLRDHAYKLMKGASQFVLDTVVKHLGQEDGPLVISPSMAPGHGPVTEGTAMDQQLIWQLLNNTLEAIAVVGERDRVFAQNLTNTLTELAPGFKIGEWGQLEEWGMDMDDPNERHPHLGPLWAVYPGNQIFFMDTLSPSTGEDGDQEGGEEEPSSDDLVEAARELLVHRGMGDRPDGNFGWAKSWRAAVWARLGDGKRAYRAIETFKRDHVTHPNLLDFEDGLSGLLGVGAAVVEMVIQNLAPGYVNVFTVADLPESWVRKGSIEGFKTREGHTVSAQWKEKIVRLVEIAANLKAGNVRVRIGTMGDEKKTPDSKITVSQKGSTKPVVFTREEDVISVVVAKGQTYVIEIDV